MKDTTNGLERYLKDIDANALLDKEQEIEVLNKIESIRMDCVLSCSTYDIYLKELQALSVSKRGSPLLQKLSKALVKQSATEELLLSLGVGASLFNPVTQRFRKLGEKVYKNQRIKIKLLKKAGLTMHQLKKSNDLEDKKILFEINQADGQIKNTLKRLKHNSVGDLLDLCHIIQKHDRLAEKHKVILVKHNLRLVVSRARKFLNRGLEMEDLIQEGNTGLMKAIEKHDVNRDIRVSTYATWWIDQAIRRAISNKSKTVRIPTHIESMYNSIIRKQNDLFTKLDRDPTAKEISEELGIKEDVVIRVLNTPTGKMSFEDDVADGMTVESVLSLEARGAEEEESSSFQNASHSFLQKKIRRVLSKLDPRTQKIIRLRFGIGYEETSDGRSLSEIGLMLDKPMGKMGVSQRIKKGLQTIKDELISELESDDKKYD